MYIVIVLKKILQINIIKFVIIKLMNNLKWKEKWEK